MTVRRTNPRPACYAAVLAAGCLAGPAAAQSLKANEVLSSVSVAPVAPPRPVRGADNRTHLAYELIVTNPTRLYVTLDKVEALGGGDSVLSGLQGKDLAAMIAVHGGTGTTLAPGGSAVVFMDTALQSGARVPPSIAARLTITRQMEGANHQPAPFPKDAGLPATVSFTTPPTRVESRPAVVIDPPLRGANWVVMNGCCDALTSHRGALMAVNGVQRLAQRFAIDWMQLRPDLRLYTGDRAKLESYAFFGAPVYAVADGRVVNIYIDSPEQVPGEKPRGIVPENIGGVMLVVDIGGGNYAFFAHLKPGSLRVKLGDRVKRGQVIAQLGNTGNSDGPHLHLHIMDGPSPLDSNGLPYVFTHFTTQGVLDEASGEGLFEKGEPAVVKPSAADGAHTNALPLNDEIVNFGK